MAHLSGLCTSLEEAKALATKTLNNGQALAKFLEMCHAQEGDLSLPLPTASIQVPFIAEEEGFIASVDAELIGRAALTLGAGRIAVTETPDLAAGIDQLVQQGEPIAQSHPLCVLHANDADRLAAAKALIKEAIRVTPEPLQPRKLIYEVL